MIFLFIGVLMGLECLGQKPNLLKTPSVSLYTFWIWSHHVLFVSGTSMG